MPRFADLLPAATDTAAATETLGRALAQRLRPGDVLALSGDLGAGKTHLVRGIVDGLGGDADDVSSPTFTLVQSYPVAHGRQVHHLDAYRLGGPEDFRAIGGDDYLDPVEAFTVIEWPERVAALLPPEALALHLRHGGGDRRTLVETPLPR